VISFKNDLGVDVKGHEAIIPIIQKRDGDFYFLATGFFISKWGLFVTAKHVFEVDGAMSFNDTYVASFHDGKFLLREVGNIFYSETGDALVGITKNSDGLHNHWNAFNKVISLELKRKPVEGDPIMTYAFPNTLVENVETEARVSLCGEFFKGEVETHFPEGRDRLMLPAECYQTNMTVLSGASGGPVFNDCGNVFALNSTGYDGQNISYVTSVSEILRIKITGVVLPDMNTPSSVQELIELGHVSDN
jgi:hypothetical protein